jgi:crotonobetainyl-CoA:carnitine CoA-transferase CaiB-like acyl-CoA transferase
LLNDILVLDLTDEQGSFCSKLLADLGATVIKIEVPEGNPAKIRNPNSYYYNNTNKLAVGIDLRTCDGRQAFRSLLKQSDVLVESFTPGDPGLLDQEPQPLHRSNPRLIHISITPFGRTAAPGNNLGLSGCLPWCTASLFGAVAALIRLKKRKITGKGSHFDLSIHEAVASMSEREMADHLNSRGNKYPASKPGSEGFSMLRTMDGFIQIPMLRNWQTLLELMASRGKAGDLHTKKWQDSAYREEHLGSIVPAVEEWTKCYTRRELLELGQAMGFPWASVDSIAEALENPQLKSRGFFVHVPLSEGGPAVSCPGLPYKFSSFSPGPLKPPPHAGSPAPAILEMPGSGRQITSKIPCPKSVSRCADEKILEGLRVIDLTRMISGPYATRILADFGAEVIKIQSENTAHGAEQNDTPSFSVWNRNKRSVTLDLGLPAARDAFLKLVAGSDVVVENFSPRVMENWGLHYKRLREVKPDLVMVSISAMGHTGPWRDFVGFAPTFHAFSGLISKTSGNLQPPADIDHPYADLIAGLYAALATLSALEYKDRTGEGQHIDLSALEAICTFLGPAYIESQLNARFEIRDSRLTVAELLRAQWLDLMQNTRLTARRFFVSLRHPVLGKVASCRTALWDWRRKPRWKASPLLGEANGMIRNSRFEIRD